MCGRLGRAATCVSLGVVLITASAPAARAVAEMPPAPPAATAERSPAPATPGAASVTERPRWGRALLEAGGALAIATVWYWRDFNLNSRDWDLQWNWETWQRKLTGGYIRLDRNEFWTNAGSHPRSGAILHNIGRSNGLGVGQSVLLNLGATTVWEYLAEFREMISLNDMVINPLAGLPIGEAVFQLGSFFRRGQRNSFNWLAATGLTPLVTVHDWMDRRPPRPSDAADDLGFSREVWHRFHVGAAFGATDFGGGDRRLEGQLALSTDLVTIPGYGRAQAVSTRARAGSLTTIDADVGFGQDRISSGRFAARALLTGLYRQRPAASGSGATGFLAGVATNFEYGMRDRPGQLRDLFARLGLPGPFLEGTIFRGPWRLRARAEATPDFTMVRPHAYQQLLRTGEGFRGVKSSIEWYGYYFAAGYTAAAELSAAHGPVDLSTTAAWNDAFSLQGLDRFQEQITDDFSLRDQRLSLRASAGVRVPGTAARLALEGEAIHRAGRIPARGLSASTLDRRAFASIGLVF